MSWFLLKIILIPFIATQVFQLKKEMHFRTPQETKGNFKPLIHSCETTIYFIYKQNKWLGLYLEVYFLNGKILCLCIFMFSIERFVQFFPIWSWKLYKSYYLLKLLRWNLYYSEMDVCKISKFVHDKWTAMKRTYFGYNV